jgi:hypothetical protein
MGGKEQSSPIYISRIIPGGVADRYTSFRHVLYKRFAVLLPCYPKLGSSILYSNTLSKQLLRLIFLN